MKVQNHFEALDKALQSLSTSEEDVKAKFAPISISCSMQIHKTVSVVPHVSLASGISLRYIRTEKSPHLPKKINIVSSLQDVKCMIDEETLSKRRGEKFPWPLEAAQGGAKTMSRRAEPTSAPPLHDVDDFNIDESRNSSSSFNLHSQNVDRPAASVRNPNDDSASEHSEAEENSTRRYADSTSVQTSRPWDWHSDARLLEDLEASFAFALSGGGGDQDLARSLSLPLQVPASSTVPFSKGLDIASYGDIDNVE